MLVWRPVSKREVARTPAALAALQKEWDKLRAVDCWDENDVMEWSDVAALARRTDKKYHVGRIFEICVEKGSELPAGDPGRKFKGRVVFQGNQVRDEAYDWAIFGEVSSAPSTMEAGRCVDAHGLRTGNAIEQCDADSAYTQSLHLGEATYVELPQGRWPKSWFAGGNPKYRRPVCRLIKALCGHPESGASREKHCYRKLKEVGFEAIKEWSGTFYHPRLKLCLVVYVDDFKMSGPVKNLAEGWRLIRKHIKTDEPAPVGKHLGCSHKVHDVKDSAGRL